MTRAVILKASAFARGFARGIRPEPIISPREWGNAHFYLSGQWSTNPGWYDSSLTPYVDDVLDALAVTHPCTDVTLQWGSQLGKTTVGLVWSGYVVDSVPAPMMHVYPTKDLAQRFSRFKLGPSIAETPRLRGRVTEHVSRASANTALMKSFDGGFFALAGANVAAALAELSIRFTVGDEVDRWPLDVGEEGDPVALLEARTRNFGDRKKRLWAGSPTIAGRSKIESKFLDGDQNRYYVPCPECGAFQVLTFGDRGGPGLTWDKGKPETAVYVCAKNGCVVEERMKTRMLEAGEWRAKHPERARHHRSFQLSSLYSPLGWYSWAEIAQDWERTPGRPHKLRAFINTTLAETWEQKGEAPDWEKLYNRREAYEPRTVPPGGLVLTAGVDVQEDRLEGEVVAWGRDLQTWSVDYVVIPGDTRRSKVWDDLTALLNRTYPGGPRGDFPMPVRLLAIDSGFRPTQVYQWARNFPPDRVIATKGRHGLQVHVGHPRVVDLTIRGRRVARGARWWPVGTDHGKSELYSWLYLDPPEKGEPFPPGFCHFPEWDDEYFKGLTAEHLVPRKVRGRGYGESVRYGYEKHRERNEPLDCRLQARAASVVLGVDRWTEADWDAIMEAMREAPEGERKGRRRRRRSGYLDRWHPGE